MLKILFFLCYLVFFYLDPNNVLLLIFTFNLSNHCLQKHFDGSIILNEQIDTPLHAPDKTRRVLPT